jgi:hypothetical protein
MFVLPEEYEEGLRILRYWHDERGMSYESIGIAMGGLFKTTVQKIPRNKTMRRETFDALKRINFVMPYRPDTHRRSGAHVDVTGTRRRLQALNRHGYPQRWLAGYFAMDQRCVSRIMLEVAFVYTVTRTEIAQGYEKLAQATPEDMGVDPVQAKRARLGGERAQYAPPGCWDEDTIEDPNAFPEWTGQCGSIDGYYLHLKYDILVHNYGNPETGKGHQTRKVLCQACVDARGADTLAPVKRSDFDWTLIGKLLKEGRVHRQIAEIVGCSNQTVQRVANRLKQTENWQPPRDRRKAVR